MSNERLLQPAQRKPYEDFGLTEQEHLFWRVRDGRFKEILNNDQTIIHAAQESSNNYGDFLFVTVSRPGDTQRICMTFYGLGYHEQRERWISDEWLWYQTEPYPDALKKTISKVEAQELLKLRLEDIAPDARQDTQSEHGKLFENLA